MKSISINEIQLILTKEFNLDLILKSGFYTKFSLGSSDFISYSSQELYDESIIGSGQIIMEFRGHQWYLLPSILGLIVNVERVKINSHDILEKITRGRVIEIDVSSGIYLIVDHFDRTHALGRVSSNKFTPIIDTGAFLRLESYSNDV